MTTGSKPKRVHRSIKGTPSGKIALCVDENLSTSYDVLRTSNAHVSHLPPVAFSSLSRELYPYQ